MDELPTDVNEPLNPATEDEVVIVTSLRPNSFSEYTGQERVKENLLIACGAAKRREQPLDHVLLNGPPGLGKTSLAKIIATELGVGISATSGPVLERPGDLAAMLTGLMPRDVLFIDEIHRLPKIVEEVLYSAMEDFELDIVIGQGPAARSVKVKLKPFTLIGATTRTGLLSFPLRDRFGMNFRLDYYDIKQLNEIIKRSAGILNIEIDAAATDEIATRARGTPRIANRFLKRARDYAEERCSGRIDLGCAKKTLELLEVDPIGLDKMDRAILEVILDKFDGGPVGLDTIATAVGEESGTLEDVYEPFLVQQGFIQRTRQGRKATDAAYRHLERVAPNRTVNLF